MTSFYYGWCVFACVHEDMRVTFFSPSVCYAYISTGRRGVYVSVCVCVRPYSCITQPSQLEKSVITALQADGCQKKRASEQASVRDKRSVGHEGE